MKRIKEVNVNATFPTAIAKAACQSAIGKGSNISVAVKRALDQIMKRNGIKGTRVKAFKLTVSVLDPNIE